MQTDAHQFAIFDLYAHLESGLFEFDNFRVIALRQSKAGTEHFVARFIIGLADIFARLGCHNYGDNTLFRCRFAHGVGCFRGRGMPWVREIFLVVTGISHSSIGGCSKINISSIFCN